MSNAPATEKTSVPAERPERTVSEQFTQVVVREFASVDTSVGLTPYQKKLAQHMFIKIDASMKDLEAKRLDKNPQGKPIIWANINMNKLALDAMHRIELNLDALIPNHISPIPYYNKRLEKYDLDLRIGYAGKDLYRREMAVDPPIDVVYELVCENDIFKPIKKSAHNPVESYEFEIPNPFDRGKIVGGFAYLVFKDAQQNRLVIVTEKDFKKSEAKAQSKDFWTAYPEEMRYKTLVNRATSKLRLDPSKINAAFHAVERQDDVVDAEIVADETAALANQGTVLSIAGSEQTEETRIDMGAPIPDQEPQAQEEPPKAATSRAPGF